ncbi:hypothetical protein [Phytomonospora endophytica]|uniref:Uncharacterized protein n=1 Tax=Phytomonospora endophytica TaxID=714109 RepID=A0A841F777_9ACTN|nr:hypothetical protein [Phytomonospora endophytica]MBB6032861.1 hypothetical protein [Phytomonospora endophytica]
MTVLPWPDGTAAPVLPAGLGGISVRSVERDGWEHNKPPRPRAVGVGGRPLWHGFGRMVAVVEPGGHLVEVRHVHVEGTRLVTVTAGELVELEYAAPRTFAPSGVLSIPPSRVVGTSLRPWLLFMLYLAGVPLLLKSTGASARLGAASTPVAVGLILAGILAVVAWQIGVRRRDARFRVRAADGPRPVGNGVLLGSTPKLVPEPAEGQGGLLLAVALSHEVRMNGMPVETSTSPHGWVPSPRLWIGDEEFPVSWTQWWYALPPGRHDLRLEVAGPLLAKDAPPSGPVPVTATVEVTAGVTGRLSVAVASRTEIQPSPENYDAVSLVDIRTRLNQSYQDWDAPTAAVAFTAKPTVTAG